MSINEHQQIRQLARELAEVKAELAALKKAPAGGKEKIYRADVVIYATAYVVADSYDAARIMLDAWQDVTSDIGFGDIVRDTSLDDPDLPVFSLSPSMTLSTESADIEEAD